MGDVDGVGVAAGVTIGDTDEVPELTGECELVSLGVAEALNDGLTLLVASCDGDAVLLTLIDGELLAMGGAEFQLLNDAKTDGSLLAVEDGTPLAVGDCTGELL